MRSTFSFRHLFFVKTRKKERDENDRRKYISKKKIEQIFVLSAIDDKNHCTRARARRTPTAVHNNVRSILYGTGSMRIGDKAFGRNCSE